MSTDQSIATLRARVCALVDQEAVLLGQAFKLSRGGEHAGVDALFAQVQQIQSERNRLTRQIGAALGTHRMHVASEVWKRGVYDYRKEVGGKSVRVRVVEGPRGLQVLLPDRQHPASIQTLVGTFDGPFTVEGADCSST